MYLSSHTNSPTTFEYAAGEYFLNFDPSIANGGSLIFSIIESELPINLQPRNPQVSGTQLKLASNIPPPSGQGYIVTGNGVKIARVRLTTTSTSLFGNADQINLQWRNGPVPPNVNPVVKIFAYVGGTLTEITTPDKHYIVPQECGNHMIPPEQIPWECCDAKLLSTNLVIEGLYNTSLNELNRKDTVMVELRNLMTPNVVSHSFKARIDSIDLSGFYVFTYPWLFPWEGQFYLVIKHHNSLETWSKITVYLQRGGGITNYNFTASDTSAFGNNLKLKGNKYCVYSGDVNQDGIIDIADMSLIDNDANIIATGNYLPTDLNGDNISDLEDLAIGDNNAINYVSVKKP
ncbi:MAG: hypothetical protein M3R36_05535 [Bacteroidota bacterium]|nr:hypothetical protein [Bacteroidota bacterium]